MSRFPVLLIRFCGGCNPEMDRGRIVHQLVGRLPPEFRVTYDLAGAADISLFVNGCAHACLDEVLEKESGLLPYPIISIQGLRVNRKPVSEKSLPNVAVEQIRKQAEFYANGVVKMRYRHT